ncbi:MAG: hypothetical protein JJE55_06805 [Flavobacteriaceae bacterium]|nr:hypothetical protein [Flavobacteriaceae bacterium]
MVQLIINESGFPKNRETLHEMQESFKVPIDELLARLPGNRILSGFVFTAGGGGATSSTEGILLYRGKLWTVAPFSGSIGDTTFISFFETTVAAEFNIGTQGSPIYENRPWKIVRTAQVGNIVDYTYIANTAFFIRGRKQLEYLKAGSIFVGPVVLDIETAIYHVAFGENIGTKDFQVLGNFRAADPSLNFSRAFVWDINNRNYTGFDVLINQATASSVPLIFDYTVIPINRTSPITGG